MTNLIPIDQARIDNMEKVALLRMQGENDTAISKQLGIQRKVVKELFEEYKMGLQRDSDVSDRARDMLNVMVSHYDNLIKESYALLKDLKDMALTTQVAAQVNMTLKNISEYDAKRVDALQKAGLLEGRDLGDELAAREEREALILDILRSDLCANCRITVGQKLQKLTQQVEAVVVYDG